jgi:DNA-binding response OmpR family regulator
MGEVLRLRGYEVDEAASGQEALALLDRAAYDLMLLDMVMPGMHGVEVMHRARQRRPDLVIIVLTAHATLDSAIASVKVDVTDYMLKPCNTDDLVVTISRALQERAKQQRRQRMLDLVGEAMNMLQEPEAPIESVPTVASVPVADDSFLRVGPLTLDRGKRTAIVDGDAAHPIELTDGEVSVLETLMQHPDQVMSIKELADSALGYQGMDKWTVESVVRSCVFRLRQKIETSPDNPRFICTVRGRGYFFRAGNPLSMPGRAG